MAKQKITAEEIKRLLDNKFHNIEQSMIAFEVGDGTGSNQRRTADAVSFEFWPSRGLEVVGYEIKVSRSDWLNELKQPDKSAAISRYCDKFYLVAPPGVLGIDELPKTWGYTEVQETGYGGGAPNYVLRPKMKAPLREVTPLNRTFAASLIRCALRKYNDKKLLNAMVEERRIAIESRLEYQFKTKIETMQRVHQELLTQVERFQETTGVSLGGWKYRGTAEALRFMQDKNKRKGAVEELKQRLHQHKFLIDNEQKMLEAIENWPEGEQDENES